MDGGKMKKGRIEDRRMEEYMLVIYRRVQQYLRSDKPLSLTIAFAWSMMVEQSTYIHIRTNKIIQ